MPRFFSRHLTTSRPSDDMVNAPSRPNAYMCPSRVMLPSVLRITMMGTITVTAMAMIGVPSLWLRRVSTWGRKCWRASAMNTW
jgi:hypothetical protein